jgi:hypothetical protein
MQWETLPALHEAPALDDGDLACLDEIRAVLAWHRKLDRFAVHLAHQHFAVGPDESWSNIPTLNRGGWQPWSSRVPAIPGTLTTWLFEDARALRLSEAVYCVCVSDPVYQAGCVRHAKSPSPGESAVSEERAKRERIQREEYIDHPVAGHGERLENNPGWDHGMEP